MPGGLIIRLKPHEKLLINGVILENGERRAKLRVRSQEVNILRLRDALHPDDATTPVTRIYYKAQLAITGDLAAEDAVDAIVPALQALHDAMPNEECRELIDQARNRARSKEFYHLMRLLKQLIPHERRLLLLASAKDFETTMSRAGG